MNDGGALAPSRTVAVATLVQAVTQSPAVSPNGTTATWFMLLTAPPDAHEAAADGARFHVEQGTLGCWLVGPDATLP